MNLKIALVIACLFISGWAEAAVSDVTVDLSTASNYEPIAEGTQTTHVIYGGYAGAAGSCANPLENSVCSSCDGMGDICTAPSLICNSRSIHDRLGLVIYMRTDIEFTTSPTVLVLAGGVNGTAVSGVTSDPVNPRTNETFSVRIPWSSILTALGSGVNFSTPGGVSGDIHVGLQENSSGAFISGTSQAFQIKVRVAEDPGVLITPDRELPIAVPSFTDFRVLAGDGKVYIDDIWRGASGPTESIKWQALRIFYAVDDGNYCSINYGSGNFTDLLIRDKLEEKPRLVDNKVTGLTNEVEYMFNIASVDETGNVSGFLQPADLALNPDRYTARPGEVVGLLDDQKCFIATAAFGSWMDPQVELLRRFRSQILMNSSLGRKFVQAYYKYSPPFAQVIAQNEVLRAVVRGFLWPLVLFADLSLQFGFLLTSAFFILAAGILWKCLARLGRIA